MVAAFGLRELEHQYRGQPFNREDVRLLRLNALSAGVLKPFILCCHPESCA